jgi:hypothetical protein
LKPLTTVENVTSRFLLSPYTYVQLWSSNMLSACSTDVDTDHFHPLLVWTPDSCTFWSFESFSVISSWHFATLNSSVTG